MGREKEKKEMQLGKQRPGQQERTGDKPRRKEGTAGRGRGDRGLTLSHLCLGHPLPDHAAGVVHHGGGLELHRLHHIADADLQREGNHGGGWTVPTPASPAGGHKRVSSRCQDPGDRAVAGIFWGEGDLCARPTKCALVLWWGSRDQGSAPQASKGWWWQPPRSFMDTRASDEAPHPAAPKGGFELCPGRCLPNPSPQHHGVGSAALAQQPGGNACQQGGEISWGSVTGRGLIITALTQ